MKRYIIPLLLFAAIGTSVAQETVKFTAAKHNDYGLIYRLPRTQLVVEVLSEKEQFKAGAYYPYAKTYLGITQAITEDSETWRMKEVRIHTVGVPDREAEYLVSFRKGSTPFLFLTPDNLLLSVNIQPQITQPYQPLEAAPSTQLLTEADYAALFTEEMMRSGSEAKMAELAAKQLYRIRKSRTNLVTGDVDQLPADGESFKLVMDQLDAQERVLTAMFLGESARQQRVDRITLDVTGDVSDEVIFRFSKHLGLVDKNDLSGEPIYLNLKATERGEYPLDEEGKELAFPKNGLPYRVAGKAAVSLQYKGETVADEEVGVAQFGVIYGLEARLFEDKKSPAYLQLDGTTGGIKEIGKVTLQK